MILAARVTLLSLLYACCGCTGLKRYFGHTDVNGFLRLGSMFLGSGPQIRTLLQGRHTDWPWSSDARMLDVGAGDGQITGIDNRSTCNRIAYVCYAHSVACLSCVARVAQYFDDVTTTEVAPQMVKRLRQLGYRYIDSSMHEDAGRASILQVLIIHLRLFLLSVAITLAIWIKACPKMVSSIPCTLYDIDEIMMTGC